MYLRVYVTPGEKRDRIEKEAEAWRISVREPAEGNRANGRVRELVARELSLPLSAVRILTGQRARSKLLSIDTD